MTKKAKKLNCVFGSQVTHVILLKLLLDTETVVFSQLPKSGSGQSVEKKKRTDLAWRRGLRLATSSSGNTLQFVVANIVR